MTKSVYSDCFKSHRLDLVAVCSRFMGLFLLLFVQTAFSEEWVPVYEEPQHRLVFENEQAYILDVFLPPGYVSLYHQHKIDLLYVTIVGTQVWAQPLNGKKREADVKIGDLRFSSDNHPLPQIHRVGNIGETPFHVIGIGRKGELAPETISLEGDTSGMELDMEKEHASVYRIKLKPGEKTGMHKHNLPFTNVYLNAGQIALNTDSAKSVQAGDYLWQDGGVSHSYENTGSESIEIIEMQWR
jgi:quercetin dioxygenase-like cupin family protein